MKYLQAIHHYDTLVFLRLINFQDRTTIRYGWSLLSKTGNGPLYLIAILVVGYLQGFNHALVELTSVAFLIERPCYFILKNGLQRHRPQDALANFQSFIVPHDKFSFPSGHTSAAVLMAVLVSFVWPSLSVILIIWAAGVGISRVMLGVHFPTDILAGACLGIASAKLSLHLLSVQPIL